MLRTRPACTFATVAALALASAPTASPATAVRARTRSFHGQISAASGRFAASRGAVAISNSFASGRIGVAAPLRLTLRGALSGTLTGTASQHIGIPDTGALLRLDARGSVSALGAVTATGTARGTGFIARGRLGLTLTLYARGGTVTIQGHSELVPGFTRP